MKTMKKVSVIAMVVSAILFTPVAAFANSLVATSPMSGATLQSAPSAITVTTELALMDAGNEISVTDPTGVRVDDGALTIDGVNAVI